MRNQNHPKSFDCHLALALLVRITARVEPGAHIPSEVSESLTPRLRAGQRAAARRPWRSVILYAESGQTSQSSFSAVSKPNSAMKYSLESSRRDLHKALLCTVLESNPKNQENHGEKRTWSIEPRPVLSAQFLSNFANVVLISVNFFANFAKICRILSNFA